MGERTWGDTWRLEPTIVDGEVVTVWSVLDPTGKVLVTRTLNPHVLLEVFDNAACTCRDAHSVGRFREALGKAVAAGQMTGVEADQICLAMLPPPLDDMPI